MNIVKTWLIGTTGGATYPITDWFLKKIHVDEKGCKFVADVVGGAAWDDCIGPCPYLRLDSPDLEDRAKEIIRSLNDLVDNINLHPGEYGFPLNYEKKALRYAEKVGVYEFKVNGHLMEYWTFYGSEGWYFVRYDLENDKEVFRGANIPWDETLGVPKFLLTAEGAIAYNYMQG